MGNSTVTIDDPITKKEITYSMDDRLRQNLSKVVKKALQKKDKDYFLILDGMEGAGKSTLAMQIGKFVDPTLTLERICFTPNKFREAIFKASKAQCVIFDEGFTGLSSRAALSKVNKMLISLMMQMRQKNLFVIIVLPTIFLLDKYVAIHRASSLIHIYETKGVRGYFRLYSAKKKKLLYLIGKPTYDYTKPRTDFHGRFYGKFALGKEEQEEEYRKKKEKALIEIEFGEAKAIENKYMLQRNLIIKRIHKDITKSYRKTATWLKESGFEMSHTQVADIVRKDKEKATKS